MESKKKIFMIATTPLNNDGLTKIEMDVILYCQDYIIFDLACGYELSHIYAEKLQALGVCFYKLPDKKKILSYMFAIQNLVKRKKYSTVYIHGNSAMMFLETIPSKLGGAKTITHCHNTKSNFPLFHYMLKPFFNAAADVKIGCSIFATKWAYMGKRIITIPNGVDLMRFCYDEEKSREVRKKLGWETEKIVGHIGRMNKQKNHKKLISVFHRMHGIDDSVRLLLIGNGELKEDIATQIEVLGISDLVKIINNTDRPQDYMQAMDIMVLPSLFEGLCLVAIEAQANGLPVLLDDLFSPETRVSDLAFSLKLTESDEIWAKKTLEIMKAGRHDVMDQIRANKMEYHVMMDRIKKVLLSV